MHSFQDATGLTRNVELNVFNVEKIRSSCQFRDGTPVDLYLIAEEEISSQPDQNERQKTVLEKLQAEPETLCKVIHACLNCSFEEFAAAMNGQSILAATDALIQEIIDFLFPSRRQAYQMAYEKSKQLDALHVAKATEMINSPQFEAMLQDQIPGFGRLSGKSPVDSTSTLDHSQPDN